MSFEALYRRLGRTEWGSDAQLLAEELRAAFRDMIENGVGPLKINPQGNQPGLTIIYPDGSGSSPIQINIGDRVYGPDGTDFTGWLAQVPANEFTAGPITFNVPRTDVPNLSFADYPGFSTTNPLPPDFTPPLSLPPYPPGFTPPPGSDAVPLPNQNNPNNPNADTDSTADPGPSVWPDGGWTSGAGVGGVFTTIGTVVSGTGAGPYRVTIRLARGVEEEVEATIPQIDEDEQVPAGTTVYVTGLLATAGGYEYFFQPPVWLSDA